MGACSALMINFNYLAVGVNTYHHDTQPCGPSSDINSVHTIGPVDAIGVSYGLRRLQ